MSARRDRARQRAFGSAALAFLAVFLGGAFVLLPWLAAEAPDSPSLLGDPYLRGVVAFTLGQAGLSTLLAVAGGLPLALALHRGRFPGRSAVLRIFLLPQALPTLVAALGIVAVFGRSGVLSDAAALLGLPRLDIYGLPGILVAHAFFNVPLVARLVFAALSAVPAEGWKLAGQLSLPSVATFRILEWPAVRTVLPGAAGLVFVLCLTSFSLVLVLGGGPAATTLEVAIYQSLRYDFDPGRAVALSVAQVALVALVLVPLLRVSNEAAAFSLGAPPRRFDKPSRRRRILDRAVVAAGLAFVLAPFAAILAEGLRADLAGLLADPGVRRAALTSLLVALASTGFSLLLALPLAFAAQTFTGEAGADAAERRAGRREGVPRRAARLAFALSGSLVLAVPPIVIGAAWFLVLRRFGDVGRFAPAIVALTNAVMAMPFVVRIVSPELAGAARRGDRLAASLGLFGLARLRHVEWPALRGPLGLACAFSFALSLGDLGAVALFGSQDLVTLPYLLLQRMGSYRSSDAEGLALLLGLLCLALTAVAERGFRLGEAGR